MSDPTNKNSVKIEKLLNDDWQERSPQERRSDIDNRNNGKDKLYFENGGKERRKLKERRKTEERRDGWMRVGQWRSVSVFDDKK